MTAQHIAVVDDETAITELLARYLSSHGFRTTSLQSGRALMETLPNDPPDLVLLDLGLPGEDGLAIARQLREHWRCGLVIITGRGDAIDKVVGLEIGADDYITKPFDLRELLARVRAVLRRVVPAPAQGLAIDRFAADVAAPAPEAGPECLGFDGWRLDLSARRLTDSQDHEVVLTAGEFDLLQIFAQNPGRVLSRDFLLSQTRGREAGPFDRTIDVQVGRLRKKLEPQAQTPQIIKSVRSAGYLFTPAVAGVARGTRTSP